MNDVVRGGFSTNIVLIPKTCQECRKLSSPHDTPYPMLQRRFMGRMARGNTTCNVSRMVSKPVCSMITVQMYCRAPGIRPALVVCFVRSYFRNADPGSVLSHFGRHRYIDERVSTETSTCLGVRAEEYQHVHYEYIAGAQKTPFCVKLCDVCVNHVKQREMLPRKVFGHLLKP